MASSSIEEKKDWDEDIEPAPDSTVRPTAPPAMRTSSQPPASSRPTSSRPSVQIGSIRPVAQSSMSVTVSFGVSPELLAATPAGGWYLTVSRVDGVVLFEGPLDDMGTLDVVISIPCGTKTVKALLESSTKYRHAVVTIAEHGATTHTFV